MHINIKVAFTQLNLYHIVFILGWAEQMNSSSSVFCCLCVISSASVLLPRLLMEKIVMVMLENVKEHYGFIQNHCMNYDL